MTHHASAAQAAMLQQFVDAGGFFTKEPKLNTGILYACVRKGFLELRPHGELGLIYHITDAGRSAIGQSAEPEHSLTRECVAAGTDWPSKEELDAIQRRMEEGTH